MQTHDLHTVCIRKTIWIAFYLITLSCSTTDYFYVGRSYWNPDTFFLSLLLKLYILQAGANGLSSSQDRKGLFPVISV